MSDTEFKRIVNLARDYTVVGPERLAVLYTAVSRANGDGLPGDIVECGVLNGGSAAVLASNMGADRKIWLYDSFEGLPDAAPQDGAKAKLEVGTAVGSIEKVQEVLAKVGVSSDRYIIRPGWFTDTFSLPKPDTVAVLHLDADWYEATLLGLETFYDRIPDGGWVVLDDFGYWEGCRKGFYEFCRRTGIEPLVRRGDCSQLYWIKGEKHYW
jgi:O-methyltransferase